MTRTLPLIAALSASLVLGGFSAGVQPRVASGVVAAPLAQALSAETQRRMADEFASQPVAFALGGTRSWPVDAGLVRVRGEGVADFGAEGEATATIEALYDPAAQRWVKLDYQLL